MQGSKYQRRWFELTTDTLAYAKDPKELKDGSGDLEVFAVHELKYIKKLEEDKLEVRIYERRPQAVAVLLGRPLRLWVQRMTPCCLCFRR